MRPSWPWWALNFLEVHSLSYGGSFTLMTSAIVSLRIFKISQIFMCLSHANRRGRGIPRAKICSHQRENLQMAVTSPSWIFFQAAFLLALMAYPFVSPNSEGDALHALRRSLTDPDNVLQSWDPTLVNPCTWFHVSCDQNNHVTRVDLGNSNISGHLVPELGRLEHLQYLELYKNNIAGTIPEELGNLKSLISMDVYENKISGEIPQSLGNLKSLVFLRLNNNMLIGQIPRELTTIPNLKVLDVSNNNLCGTIPTNGAFQHFPLKSFDNNPRLRGPELQGLVSYNSGC